MNNVLKSIISIFSIQKNKSTNSLVERTISVDNRVWNELCDAKKYDYYLSEYLRDLRTRRKNINFGIIIISIIAIALENWVNNASFFTLLGLTVFQIIKDIFPLISVDEKLIDKLPEYRMLYVQKFELLNRLYFDIEQDKISDEEATQEYFKIREMNIRIEEMDNSLHLPEKNKLFKTAVNKSLTYMKNYFELELDEEK